MQIWKYVETIIWYYLKKQNDLYIWINEQRLKKEFETRLIDIHNANIREYELENNKLHARIKILENKIKEFKHYYLNSNTWMNQK